MNSTPALRTGLGLAIATLLAAAAGNAFATEYGTVVSSTPVVGEVAVPQRQCFDEEQAVAPARRYSSSGAGALVGAVIGGVVGNSVGAGFGRAAATGIGAVAGAAIGDQVEANSTPPAPVATTTVRRCQNVTRREQRVIGYDVVYDYAGQRYNARLARDPGERIALNVNVAPVGALPPARSVPPAYDEGAAPPAAVYAPAAPGYAAPPLYAAPPVYAPPPVVWGGPSIYVAPTLWFGGSWGGHRHWH
jgi:uncharacterized protein YcfJ